MKTFREIIDEGKKDKTAFECMECGAKFKKKMPKSMTVKCPKCKSEDVDLMYGMGMYEAEQLDSVVIKGVGYVATDHTYLQLAVEIGEMRPGARVNFRPLKAAAKKLNLEVTTSKTGATMSKEDWEKLKAHI